MEALALLARLRAAGFHVEVRDDDLLVRGPRTGHETILAELRAAKPAMLAALRAAEVSLPVAVGRATWVEIDGRRYSPAAADLYRRSVPFTAAMAASDCRCCGGTRHWRLHDGCPWVCARCHPSARPAAELEWKGSEAPAPDLSTVTPPDPAAPVDAGSQEVPCG